MSVTDPERLAFLIKIEEDPGDDAPKLAYSDWLEEERGEKTRADWIRKWIRIGRGIGLSPRTKMIGLEIGAFVTVNGKTERVKSYTRKYKVKDEEPPYRTITNSHAMGIVFCMAALSHGRGLGELQSYKTRRVADGVEVELIYE